MGQPGSKIRSDLLCASCGCNLLGQPKTGECPECGMLVAESLPPVMLKESDPDWIRALRNGTSWMLAGIACYFILMLFIGIMTARLIEAQPNNLAPGKTLVLPGWYLVTNLALMAVVSIILCIAIWQITTPEPEALRPQTTRDIARWALLASYALMMIAIVVQLPQSEDSTALATCLHALAGLLSLIGTVSLLAYLRDLAMRLPDTRLAGHTKAVQLGTIGAVVVGFVAFMGLLGSIASPNNPQSRPPPLALIALMLAGLAMLVLVIWWVVLILRFRGWFATAHRMAVYHAHNQTAVRY